MKSVSLRDILVTPLKRINTIGGDVMHALKKNDECFNGFGEVYFSWLEKGVVKAWKCHKQMTMNLIVPYGDVRFVFNLADEKYEFRVEIIGENNYARLTVPPGIWFGCQCFSKNPSLIMNIANIVHSPNEVKRKKIVDINYNWDD